MNTHINVKSSQVSTHGLVSWASSAGGAGEWQSEDG